MAGLDISVDDGSFTVIVGPNACGKSTLLRSLSKVLPPRSGTVLLGGREISSMHPKVFVRQVGFLAQPRILLLDEPTTYLDLAHQVEVLELCRELNQVLGTTIVAVLHDLNQACRYADRIVVMRAGRILARGRPAQVITPQTIHEAFGLEVCITPDPVTGTPLILPSPPRAHVHFEGP